MRRNQLLDQALRPKHRRSGILPAEVVLRPQTNHGAADEQTKIQKPVSSVHLELLSLRKPSNLLCVMIACGIATDGQDELQYSMCTNLTIPLHMTLSNNSMKIKHVRSSLLQEKKIHTTKGHHASFLNCSRKITTTSKQLEKDTITTINQTKKLSNHRRHQERHSYRNLANLLRIR